jgi:hypothetical protein
MKGHKKGQRTKDFRIKPNRPCKNIIKHCKWEELPTFNRLWHQKKKKRRKKIWHQKMQEMGGKTIRKVHRELDNKRKKLPR